MRRWSLKMDTVHGCFPSLRRIAVLPRWRESVELTKFLRQWNQQKQINKTTTSISFRLIWRLILFIYSLRLCPVCPLAYTFIRLNCIYTIPPCTWSARENARRFTRNENRRRRRKKANKNRAICFLFALTPSQLRPCYFKTVGNDVGCELPVVFCGGIMFRKWK